MVDRGCWYMGCMNDGLPRPIFAQAHDLHASLRLCERHMSELSREPDRAGTLVHRPPRDSNPGAGRA